MLGQGAAPWLWFWHDTLPMRQGVGCGYLTGRVSGRCGECQTVSPGRTRVLLVCGDLASAFAGTFDLVVANLPYIARAELDTLPPDVGPTTSRDWPSMEAMTDWI